MAKGSVRSFAHVRLAVEAAVAAGDDRSGLRGLRGYRATGAPGHHFLAPFCVMTFEELQKLLSELAAS